MFDKPLLQDNIWNNLLNFNYFYLTSSAWVLWIGIVLFVMSCAILSLRKSLVSTTIYANAYDNEAYLFDKSSKCNWVGLFFLIIAIVLTALRMFTLENSLFENFDLMAINTTKTLYFGLEPSFDEYRIAPIAFWPLSTLYAITHNIYMIKTFVLGQLIIATILLYYLLDYITVTKRLILISLFLLSPTMMQTSNIIFVERETIIALAASLIFAKKYCKNQKLSNFFGFMFFMIIAIYTKETCCLFFGGLVAASILWNIWYENINLKSFLHPFKSIKTFPVEFLIALNLFLYATIYFILMRPEISYAAQNSFDPIFLIFYYKFELLIGIIALAVLGLSCYNARNLPVNPLFRGSGFVCGGLLIAIGIIFYLKLAPTSPHLYLKTYYLVLTLLFSLSYLFQQIRNKKILASLILIISTYSFVQNINFYKNEQGVFYREVAEFLAQNLNKDKENIIYLAERTFERDNLSHFIIQSVSSAYRYYFQGYNITFKSRTSLFIPKHALSWFPLLSLLHFSSIPTKDLPKSGEWLILNKMADFPDILESLAQTSPDFENNLFKVYHIK